MPFSIKWKMRFLRDCTRLSKIREYKPLLNWRSVSTKFMTIERPDVLNRFMGVP